MPCRQSKAQTCGSILDRNWGTKNSRSIGGKLVFRLERAAPNAEGAAVVNKIAISSLSGPRLRAFRCRAVSYALALGRLDISSCQRVKYASFGAIFMSAKRPPISIATNAVMSAKSCTIELLAEIPIAANSLPALQRNKHQLKYRKHRVRPEPGHKTYKGKYLFPWVMAKAFSLTVSQISVSVPSR